MEETTLTSNVRREANQDSMPTQHGASARLEATRMIPQIRNRGSDAEISARLNCGSMEVCSYYERLF